MGAQQKTEKPFQRLYIDFMGPYPLTREGNQYLFVVLDHFSKFVLLKPMRNALTTHVIKYLERDVIKIFGCPEYIHSDNGKQFVSEAFKAFTEKFGINHIKTAYYSPQANASERVNRSVLQIIRSYVKEDQRNWDEHVSDAAFALRSAFHSAIGLEPYYTLFGFTMMQHGAAYTISRKLDSLGQEDFRLECMNDKQRLIRQKVLNQLKLAYEKAAKIYNTRSRNVQYKPGQLVYRKNFKQSAKADRYNAKLAPTNIKCIIVKSVGSSLYELANLAGKNIGLYHAKDLFMA